VAGARETGAESSTEESTGIDGRQNCAHDAGAFKFAPLPEPLPINPVTEAKTVKVEIERVASEAGTVVVLRRRATASR